MLVGLPAEWKDWRDSVKVCLRWAPHHTACATFIAASRCDQDALSSVIPSESDGALLALFVLVPSVSAPPDYRPHTTQHIHAARTRARTDIRTSPAPPRPAPPSRTPTPTQPPDACTHARAPTHPHSRARTYTHERAPRLCFSASCPPNHVRPGCPRRRDSVTLDSPSESAPAPSSRHQSYRGTRAHLSRRFPPWPSRRCTCSRSRKRCARLSRCRRCRRKSSSHPRPSAPHTRARTCTCAHAAVHAHSPLSRRLPSGHRLQWHCRPSAE